MSRLIIALAGYPGTGKSTLAAHAETMHGFATFEGSDLIRAHSASEGRVLSRREDFNAYLTHMQESLGNSCLAETVLQQPGNRLMHVGLRAQPDFRRIKEAGGLIISLICPDETCLERIDTDNPKNPSTLDEYKAIKLLEDSGNVHGGLSADWCVEHADVTLDSSRPLAVIYGEFDSIVKRQLSLNSC